MVWLMAKGNDGNLLQHAVEVAVADYLMARPGAESVHLVCTHAMAPFEQLTEDPASKAACRLRGRLALAQLEERSSSLLVEAFQAVRASPAHYPNTCVLVEALATKRTCHLSGVLLDANKQNAADLQTAFPGMTVIPDDWRNHLESISGQAAEACCWLVSMDPYKFTLGSHDDPGVLDAADVASLQSVLTSYTQNNAPGALLIFVYGMFPKERAGFYSSVATHLVPHVAVAGVLTVDAGDGGKRHVGLVLGTERSLVEVARSGAASMMPGFVLGCDPKVSLGWNVLEARLDR